MCESSQTRSLSSRSNLADKSKNVGAHLMLSGLSLEGSSVNTGREHHGQFDTFSAKPMTVLKAPISVRSIEENPKNQNLLSS